MPEPSHYETLGVSREASAGEVRAAYRELARKHHPDRNATLARSSQTETMPAVNEAYRVLGDAARRAVYDASLRDGSAVGSAAPAGAGPSSRSQPATGVQFRDEPKRARIAWRWALTIAVAVVVGGVVLSLFSGAPTPPVPDGILRVGDCVEIESDLDAREISCTGDAEIDQVVLLVVDFNESCPARAEPHRDHLGMGIACVEVPS